MVPQSLVHSGGRSPKQRVPFVAGVGGETLIGSLRSGFHQINPLSRPEDDPLACLDIAR
jgi:hypothetical protein